MFAERKLFFFNEDVTIPFLYDGKMPLSFEERFQVLFLDVDISKICTKRRNCVMRYCGFVIDRSTLRDPSDWLTTDLGSFERRGPSARVFEVNGSEILNSCSSRGRKEDNANLKKNEYLVKTVVSRHRRYTDFQRTATVILDSTGNELQLGLIQYAFVGEEHKISPHKHPVSKKPFIPTAPSTSKLIQQEVHGFRGPSSIFDVAVERAGGIAGCEEMGDMPRDKKQVMNVRSVITSKTKEDEFSSLLSMAKTDQTVHNLQWTPAPRVIFSTDDQVKDIIEECCNLNTTSILSIDTTFNVGDFYVTSTTYQSSKFSNVDTGKRANLPGPAMFHVTRTKKDYQAFCHALLEINENIELVNYVGGDRDKAQAGFLIPLKGATFLPCTKHVQDDVARKLTELELSSLKAAILADIFGSEARKEKGLEDSYSKNDFVQKADPLYWKWDAQEKEVRHGKNPEFSSYFRCHIKEDMLKSMILPVRRSAGLRDDFFYNNDQECSNFKFK